MPIDEILELIRSRGLFLSFLDAIHQFAHDCHGMVTDPASTINGFTTEKGDIRLARSTSFYLWNLLLALLAIAFFQREVFAWPKIGLVDALEFLGMNTVGVLIFLCLVSRQTFGRFTSPRELYPVFAGCSVVFVPIAVSRSFFLQALDQRMAYAMAYMGTHGWPSPSAVASPKLILLSGVYFALVIWGVSLLFISMKAIEKTRRPKPWRRMAVAFGQYLLVRWFVFLVLFLGINFRAAMAMNQLYGASLSLARRNFPEALVVSQNAAETTYLPPYHRFVMLTVAAVSQVAAFSKSAKGIEMARLCILYLEEQKFVEAFQFLQQDLRLGLSNPEDQDYSTYQQANNILAAANKLKESPVFAQSANVALSFENPPAPFGLIPGWLAPTYTGFSYRCKLPDFRRLVPNPDPLPCDIEWGFQYIWKKPGAKVGN